MMFVVLGWWHYNFQLFLTISWNKLSLLLRLHCSVLDIWGKLLFLKQHFLWKVGQVFYFCLIPFKSAILCKALFSMHSTIVAHSEQFILGSYFLFPAIKLPALVYPLSCIFLQGAVFAVWVEIPNVFTWCHCRYKAASLNGKILSFPSSCTQVLYSSHIFFLMLAFSSLLWGEVLGLAFPFLLDPRTSPHNTTDCPNSHWKPGSLSWSTFEYKEGLNLNDFPARQTEMAIAITLLF